MPRKISITLVVLIILAGISLSAKISEADLKKFSSEFLEKTIQDNSSKEAEIREFLNGTINEGSAGIRLIDKLGLFLYKSKSGSIDLSRVRFYSRGDVFIIFAVLEDRNDRQLYTLFLEYRFVRETNRCILENIYFSIVFEERMKELSEFFKNR